MAAPATGTVGAVVLAAGAATRFGTAKQLAPFEGTPLVRRAVDAALGAGAHPVVVIVGAHGDDVAASLAGLDAVSVVVHAEWHLGLASSLASGLAALDGADCDAALVTLADQPLVDAHALRRLLAAFVGARRIVASSYGDTCGVPAIFGREHLPALRALTGDSGARRWLRQHAALVTAVPMPEAAVDIDTPADLTRLSECRGVAHAERHDARR